MKRKVVLIILCFCHAIYGICAKYPQDIEEVLNKAGKNRMELEKVLIHYSTQRDSLKLDAAMFIIRNIDIHFSDILYWTDSFGKKVAFDEFLYPSYAEAIKAFKVITYGKAIREHKERIWDIDIIKGDYLIKNIDRAFSFWRSSMGCHLSYLDFCEYLLPYRSLTEPLDGWSNKYERLFKQKFGNVEHRVLPLLNAVSEYLDSSFFSTYGIDSNSNDILLSPSQALFRKQGGCEDLANYCLFILRSLGIATSFDYVPEWATSTGKHMWNTVIGNDGEKISFTGGEKNIGINTFKLKREPGKVIRFTYSKQKNTIASYLPENEIPDSYMRLQNYIDVTDTYWKCKDMFVSLSPSLQKYVYATVFNGMRWRPVYFGQIKSNRTVFRKMACGAIYLPMYYLKGKLINAGYPVLLENNGAMKCLKINRQKKITIKIPEKDRYLIYRANKKYRLYYWDGKWVACGSQQIQSKRELVFLIYPLIHYIY